MMKPNIINALDHTNAPLGCAEQYYDGQPKPAAGNVKKDTLHK